MPVLQEIKHSLNQIHERPFDLVNLKDELLLLLENYINNDTLSNLFEQLNTYQAEMTSEMIQENFYARINTGIKFRNFFIGLTDTNRLNFLKYHLEHSTLTKLMTDFSECIPLIKFMPKIENTSLHEVILSRLVFLITDFRHIEFILLYFTQLEIMQILNRIILTLAKSIKTPTIFNKIFVYLNNHNRMILLEQIDKTLLVTLFDKENLSYFLDYLSEKNRIYILRKIFPDLESYIKTPYLFKELLRGLKEEIVTEVFCKIKPFLYDNVHHSQDLNNLLSPLNSQQALEVLSNPGFLKFLPQNLYELGALIASLNDTVFAQISGFFNQHKIIKIEKLNDIIFLLDYGFSREKNKCIFELIKEKIPLFITDEYETTQILALLSPEQKSEIFCKLDISILSSMSNLALFMEMYHLSTLEQKDYLFNLNKNRLGRLKQDVNLQLLLQYLTPAHFEEIFSKLQDGIFHIVSEQAGLVFLANISRENLEIILINLFKQNALDKTKLAYEDIWSQPISEQYFCQPTLLRAVALLSDYTKNNSFVKRVLFFHGQRHHSHGLNEIVQEILNRDLQTEDEIKIKLFEYMFSINEMNVFGSFARRLGFILYKLSDKPLSNQPQPFVRMN